MPKIEIEFATAGEATMVRAWAAAQKAMRDHNTELGKVGPLSTNSNSALKGMAAAGSTAFRSIGADLKSVALGVIGGGGILGAWSLWKTANQEILQQAHETTLAYDALFRKFNVQSGLRGIEGKDAKEELLNTAERRAVTEETAAKGATALVSAGYTADEAVKGGATDELLQGMNAMNQRGAGTDATSLANAAAAFQTAMGVDKNAAGMRETMSSLFSAFQGTNIQLPDLQQYAAKAGGMKGKLSFQEMIAAGSVHRDLGIASAESASGLEGLVGQAGTAGASKDKIDALKTIGLKPKDIDFIGENLDTVLGRLQEGLDSVPAEKREGVMKKVFEQSGVKFLKPLLENRETISDRVTAMGEAEAGYAGAVAESEQGPNAAAARQKVEKNRRREKQDKLGLLMQEELVAMAEESGDSPARVELAKKNFEANLAASGNVDTAARAFGHISSGDSSTVGAEAKRRLAAKGIQFNAFDEEPKSEKGKGRHAELDKSLEQRRDEARAKLAEKQTRLDEHEQRGNRGDIRLATAARDKAATEFKMREHAIARKREEAAETEGGNGLAGDLKELKTALDRNTAATQGNSNAQQQGRAPLRLETPPGPTDSVSLAN